MAARSRRRRRSPRRRRAGGARLRAWLTRLTLVAVAAGAGYLAWLDHDVRARFEGKRWSVPARIYARTLDLYPGLALSAEEFARELGASGYHRVRHPARDGSYARAGGRFEVALRGFRFWDGSEPPRRVRLRFEQGRLVSLRGAGGALPLVRLDPAVIGRIYPAHHEDRVLVRLEDVPPLLVQALIAVEDRDFYDHAGISPRSIARALWANLRAGAVVQGGSTLTQQLAKNFYLSGERSLGRKLHEALIALLLEAHFSKQEILEAYLNEIFLGQQGRRAIHGFGLAAQFYFGRPLAELRLPETALLVALVRGASYYDPRRHPERARTRRNLVLDVMAGRGVVSAARAAAAKSAPLGVIAEAPPAISPYPAFVDLVRRQLHSDYRDADLRSEGLRIFSTLDPAVQARAEEALAGRLRALEQAGRARPGTLQGAVVVSAAQSGEVLAVVGDRDPRAAGFNRALNAVRQVGSLIKPAVYLTALARPGRYTLATALDDGPVRVRDRRGQVWAPQNYDGEDHGRVPLAQALAHSYNRATVRLGMDLGVAAVLDTLRRLGIERPIPAYPSLLLGAVSLSPLEVAVMYETIASGGFRVPLRAIQEVTDAHGEPLSRYALAVEPAFEPAPVYLLTRAMSRVVAEGTARSVRARLAAWLPLAGKTGTTDDLRDSWFAGFGEDRLAVVWVGRDDNAPAGLTGASGALQVWADLMAALHPHALAPATPDGVEWHWTDPALAVRTDADCAAATRVPYIAGSAPPYRPCAAVRATAAAPGTLGASGEVR